MDDERILHEQEHATAATVEAFAQYRQRGRECIKAAEQRAGREASDVRLLPVSKTVPVDRIRLGIEAGITELGENKVQEGYRKWEELIDTGVRWCVIGNLQTNKAKFVARFADEFQALDRARVAEALNRRLELEDRTLDVFVQVNTSNEESKYGVAPADLPQLLRDVQQFERLNVRGLMTLAVFSTDPALVRPCFHRLRSLRDQMQDNLGLENLTELSMGMSGDFELAIEEGATVVRVGQAIFGAREVPDSHYWPGT